MSWWSTKGDKMKVDGVVLEKGKHPIVNVAMGPAASVFVTKNLAYDSFDVNYHIRHDDGSHTSGSIQMSRADLARAFGLVSGFGEGGAVFRDRGYEPDAAAQGKYIRKDDRLNIPHPGTALQGDPNISVKLTPEMKSAIQALLNFTKAEAA